MADELQKDALQQTMSNRIRSAVQAGMVTMLNTGYQAGKKIHIARHNRTVTMPEPGATFQVPRGVADEIMRMPYRAKIQIVTGKLPQNFTPPPGYKLVPTEEQDSELDEVVDVMDMIEEFEEEEESE